MQHFSVRYHDGKTSTAHDATLTLMADHWLIHYADADGELFSVKWEVGSVTLDPNFSSLFIFRYGDFPRQTLECKEENLLAELRDRYPQSRLYQLPRIGRIGKNNWLIAGLAFAVVLVVAIGYYFILPFVAEKIAANVPQSMEISLGESLYNRMIAGYEVDDTLTSRVNAFAAEIDFGTSYPVEITVVKESQANAFALPGGHIIVFDGILKGMKSQEALAALLAHEVSHVHYRHSLKSMFRSLGAYLFISLLLTDVNGIVAVLADNSNTLMNLTYSRSLEAEADEKAMKSLASQGISLQGFVDLFTYLRQQESSVSFPILSTHPLTDDRVKRATALVRVQTDVHNQAGLDKKWVELGIR